MFDTVILNALQAQFNKERQNEASYRAKAAQAEADNYPGVAAWMRKAADEEHEHAELIEGYIISRNEVPVFTGLEMINVLPGDDLVALFDNALALEMANTQSLETLYFLAETQEDPRTCSFITAPHGDFSGFLEEQTKSEREITDILLTLRRIDKTGWLIFDHRLID